MTSTDGTTQQDTTDGTVGPDPIVLAGIPSYPAPSDLAIWRKRLYPEHGTAVVTFRGTVADATKCWVEQGTSGRLSLYAEVEPTDDTATRITVAVTPTGKPVPAIPDSGGQAATRLGSVKGRHVYLLEVDSSVDRATYDAAVAARAEQRRLDREADALNALGGFDGDGDGGDGDILD